MDFNTILVRFGLESSNFTNKLLEVIKNGDDYFYQVEEAYKKSIALIAIINIYLYMGNDG